MGGGLRANAWPTSLALASGPERASGQQENGSTATPPFPHSPAPRAGQPVPRGQRGGGQLGRARARGRPLGVARAAGQQANGPATASAKQLDQLDQRRQAAWSVGSARRLGPHEEGPPDVEQRGPHGRARRLQVGRRGHPGGLDRGQRAAIPDPGQRTRLGQRTSLGQSLVSDPVSVSDSVSVSFWTPVLWASSEMRKHVGPAGNL